MKGYIYYASGLFCRDRMLCYMYVRTHANNVRESTNPLRHHYPNLATIKASLNSTLLFCGKSPFIRTSIPALMLFLLYSYLITHQWRIQGVQQVQMHPPPFKKSKKISFKPFLKVFGPLQCFCVCRTTENDLLTCTR